MSDIALTEEDIIAFLQNTPAFFERHAGLLSEWTLPCPHNGQAISLPQKQAAVLREKLKTEETRLAHLVAHAHQNELIESQLWAWITPLLAQTQAALLPSQLTAGLGERFALDDAKLRLYGLDNHFRSCAFAQNNPDCLEVWNAFFPHREGAKNSGNPSHTENTPQVTPLPHCYSRAELESPGGFNTLVVKKVLPWLIEPEKIASLAVIPVQVSLPQNALAILVLASQDPLRFQAHMAVDFLERIAQLTQAVLWRVINTASLD
jgi:uncharacterized protein YigA (DUF484 family)